MDVLSQTIEHALGCAQDEVAHALRQNRLRLLVELPMGRARSYTQGFAPFRARYAHSTVLAINCAAQLFKGARIHLVIGHEPDVYQDTSEWIARRDLLDEFEHEAYSASEYDVILIVAASHKQMESVSRLIQNCNQTARSNETAVILFNCFLETELNDIPFVAKKQNNNNNNNLHRMHSDGFEVVYYCRAYRKTGAVLKRGVDSVWHLFVESKLFEYHWVCVRTDRDDDVEEWFPSADNLERAIRAKGIHRGVPWSYFSKPNGWKNAGFWPFMMMAFPFVTPLVAADIDALKTYQGAPIIQQKNGILGFQLDL